MRQNACRQIVITLNIIRSLSCPAALAKDFHIGDLSIKGFEVDFTLDNRFNRDCRPPLSGENASSLGRKAKISVTRFF